MPSKRTEARSIASQLVLLFTLAATLLLGCGLGLFYLMVVRHAFEEDNAFLTDKLFAVRADLKRPDWTKALDEELKAARGSERSAYWVRVVDLNGATVAETPGMAALVPTEVFSRAQGADASLVLPRNYHSRGKLFSIAAATVQTNGQRFTVQVAQDRSADEQFSRQFGALLLIALAIGIVASAAIATTVTRRGLRSLTEMTTALERIGPKHLDERLVPERWPKELRPLAGAFDHMLDRLEASFTRLSQLSADLAHELRTPLANILGESQVALTRSRSVEEYRQVIESNAGECERLSGVIDRLLFLARADAAEERAHRTVFDGRVTINKIASFYEALAEEEDVTIECSGAGEIYADPVLFGRAVSNLVENALRFTPRGGRISISISTAPAQAEVVVSDTGCGIAAEHVPHVFDRFYRADVSRSSQGAGLGLALVKSIVQLHGGSASLRSEPGRGTVVTVTFPAANVTKL